MNKNTKKLTIYKLFQNSKKYSVKWSGYFQVYEKILSEYRNKKIKFVEIGVANGGSLFMWRNYFGKKAEIIGIDLNPNAKKLERYGFKIYIGSQSDKKFWNKFYKKEGKIDIILDDGGHKNLQQISTGIIITGISIKACYGVSVLCQISKAHSAYISCSPL